tara:strand:- start:94 stop:438 length:345 start_codon:yes stop_codon:yes gene_type:complete
MKRKTEKNLALLENFILHLTHCSDYPEEFGYTNLFSLSPKLIYQAARDYIKEDHVDGLHEDSERCIDLWLEAEEANRNDNEEEALRLKKEFSTLYAHDWIDKEYVDGYLDDIGG